MTGTETDIIEWRASRTWVLQWLALLVFVVLPFLMLGAWLAWKDISEAPEGTWPAYLFFLGAFATLVLGVLTFGVLAGVAAQVMLLFDQRPIVRADRTGLEVRMPYKPTRSVAWSEIDGFEIEKQRQSGRYRYILNHVLVRLRDKAAPELPIKPQMAGISLEDGHATLEALYVRWR